MTRTILGSEAEHQEALTKWIALQWWDDAWAHWPNERWVKAERLQLGKRGVKPGLLDNWLFIPQAPYCGAVSELKRRGLEGTALSEEQSNWKERLESCGFLVAVHFEWTDAARFFAEYLGEHGP